MFCESGPWFCKTSVSEVYLSFVYDLECCISVCSPLWLWSPSVCRRLDPSERPLQMVYDYLTAMGYEDPLRVQQEAANSDLSCMIRFYSGELWAVGGRFLLYWPGQNPKALWTLCCLYRANSLRHQSFFVVSCTLEREACAPFLRLGVVKYYCTCANLCLRIQHLFPVLSLAWQLWHE